MAGLAVIYSLCVRMKGLLEAQKLILQIAIRSHIQIQIYLFRQINTILLRPTHLVKYA